MLQMKKPDLEVVMQPGSLSWCSLMQSDPTNLGKDLAQTSFQAPEEEPGCPPRTERASHNTGGTRHGRLRGRKWYGSGPLRQQRVRAFQEVRSTQGAEELGDEAGEHMAALRS